MTHDKLEKVILCILVVLMLVPVFVQATSFDFYRDDGTAGTTFHVGYEGETKNIPNIVVENKNLLCSITCDYTTDQGESGTVPGVSGGYIPATGEAKSPKFSIPATAEGDGVLTVTVTCQDENSTWCSPENSNEVSKDISLAWDYCGDGTKNGPEACEGDSKSCSSIDSKYYAGDNAPCKTDCSGYDITNCKYCGDGKINGAEECDTNDFGMNSCWSKGFFKGELSCSSDCKISTSGCSNCGNGKIDSGENCKTCPQDSPCSSGLYCSDEGNCVQCLKDEHCDTEETFSSGETKCTVDHKKAIQKGTKTYEKCENYNCIKKTEEVDETIDCTQKGTFCQDGRCGCNDGYAPCQSAGKCVEVAVLGPNTPCACDFQCKSSFCDSGRCVEGLVMSLNSDRVALKPGESTKVSISVDNPFNRKVKANLILEIGSGVGISATVSGKGCGGSQCTDIVELSENGHHEFPVTLFGNDLGTVPLKSKITYIIPGKKEIETSKEISIKFTECGREDCSSNIQNLLDYLLERKVEIGNHSIPLILLLLGVVALIIIFGSAILVFRTHARHKVKKEKI